MKVPRFKLVKLIVQDIFSEELRELDLSEYTAQFFTIEKSNNISIPNDDLGRNNTSYMHFPKSRKKLTLVAES